MDCGRGLVIESNQGYSSLSYEKKDLIIKHILVCENFVDMRIVLFLVEIVHVVIAVDDHTARFKATVVLLLLKLCRTICSCKFWWKGKHFASPCLSVAFQWRSWSQVVVKARLPSGKNPVHQLILIIANCRFHEKVYFKNLPREKNKKVKEVIMLLHGLLYKMQENLWCCFRNRRMIAFILLDSPQEPIMHLMVLYIFSIAPGFRLNVCTFSCKAFQVSVVLLVLSEACFEGQTLTFK
ncbi:hypothetical protein IEQ34_002967 [Dendrobium chrysotoxum]|uniref:Uncharacterized protein n=1 Tax=Dendrobium chrysotoxum TaxID=161865 RepID=A0AAV7HIG5_DENCH|nr:hypothetical protein IEQ34_002967 [Dendrobium chrysotoxum]